MASEARLSQVYATDEDLCVRCYADFSTLAPKDAVLAQGTDGVFSSGDLWTLASASNDFAAQDVAVGHVVQITGPSPTFKGGATKFAVGAVATGSVTLRRVGKGDGVGLPPSPAGGLSGVSFVVQTFDAQIEDVSFWINQRFGIDPDWANSSPDQVADLRVLRQATVLEVLVRAYAGDSRSKDGDFARKLGEFRGQRDDAIGVVRVRWSPAIQTPPAASLFSTRISR